jgi:uncharacterized protein
MSAPLKAVFDCNTFLQALASPGGPAGRCVQAALTAEVHLFVSSFVLEELREVAARPKVVAKLRLTPDGVERFLEAIESAATLILDVPETFVHARDPDDAHYVNLAVASGAERIVSRDNDLLDLMDPDKPDATEFARRFPRLRIVNPVEFLNELVPRP